MARRGRNGKMQAQAQPPNPSPVAPNSETETLVNAENVNSIGVTSEGTVPEKLTYVRKNVKTAQAQPLNPSLVAPNSETETLVDAENVNSIGVTSEATVPEKVMVPEKRSCVRKNVKTTSSIVVRRSGRIVKSSAQVNHMEPFVEEVDVTSVEEIDFAAVEKINVTEGDKAEESPPDQENHTHEQAQHVPAVEPVETTAVANLNYKSLYIRSQKKVKALIKKKRELRKKLEHALAKIEVYTEMTPILSSMSKSNEILCKRSESTKRFRT